jgi:Ca-activated chloride channel family protein
MEFVNPEILSLLLLLPLLGVLLIWANTRRKVALSRIGNPGLIQRLSDSINLRKRRLKVALWLGAFFLLIISAARPVWGSLISVRVQEGVEVMVVLDVSSSMLAEDIKPNRLARAKLTISELMDKLGGNEIGLVIFSGAAFLQFPITADYYTAQTFLDSATPVSISRQGTALEEALSVALDSFPYRRATSRVILLMTDGEGHEGDPLAAASKAVEQDVVIHAIGFGSPGGEPIPLRDSDGSIIDYKKDSQGETVLSHLNEVLLQQIARTTGGYYFRANAAGTEVRAVVDQIEGMATGEREEGGEFETFGVERFQWFAGFAALIFAADMLIDERVRHHKGGRKQDDTSS